MSYKLDKVTFLNKDLPLEQIDFGVEDGQVSNVLIHDKNQMKFFKRVLKGKEKPDAGRYRIDNIEVVNRRFVKSRIEFISTDKFFERLIPPKIVLTLSLLFDPKFLRTARLKFIDKKYDYKSYADSKNDITDMKVRRRIDGVISQFITGATNAEKKLLNKFYKEMVSYGATKISNLYNDFPPQVAVLQKEIFRIYQETRNKELLLTFSQVIWDSVYNYNELRNTCTCEYNAKRSSNKYIKQYSKKFAYIQPKHMITKQLKFLNYSIMELRVGIMRNNKLSKQLTKQLNSEFKKFYAANNISKDAQNRMNKEIDEVKKSMKDQRDVFEKEQREVFFDVLPKEGFMVGKKIAFLIHDYHQKLLSGTVQYGNPNEFKILKRHYKKEVTPIITQAVEWTRENLQKLDMNFEWFLKSGFKISSLNIIYLKMLKAINLQKKNIVFSNVLNLLTSKDFDNLTKTIENIKLNYPDLSFVILNNKIDEIGDLQKKIYSVKSGKMDLKDMNQVIKDNVWEVIGGTHTTSNMLSYHRQENGIEIENKFWNINNKNYLDEGKIFISPLEIKTSQDEERNDWMPIIIKIKNSNKYNDKNIHYGINNFGHKIFFYSKKEYQINKEVILYLSEDSIYKIL
ncbi:hypothetical protein [[Acholeplasma] multilocale]|uniref:hypothetical protein n=1 Tax=[Acholeplasma] multilocale TaxID=264638 RepID=UPI00047D7CEB|nr:hypothetical protein [[Acholeplasma] multilocale]